MYKALVDDDDNNNNNTKISHTLSMNREARASHLTAIRSVLIVNELCYEMRL